MIVVLYLKKEKVKMKKINKSKVIIPALALIALTTAASTTGTAAWFYASRTATVTGMTVKTQVSSSMLIAADTLDSTTVQTGFTTGTLNQSVSAFLEPASTVNGTSFFYTTNATATDDGSKASGDYIPYDNTAKGNAGDTEHYADKFSEDYSVTKAAAAGIPGTKATPFADYVFQVKALNNTAATLDLKLTNLELKRPNDVAYANASKAFRVAVFSQKATKNPESPATALQGNEGALKYIYMPSGATYQAANSAVSAANTVSAIPEGVRTLSNSSKIQECDAGAEEIFKIVVRLWIEGEDQSCTTDTFANLNSDWTLNLGLALDNSTNAATALTVTANA